MDDCCVFCFFAGWSWSAMFAIIAWGVIRLIQIGRENSNGDYSALSIDHGMSSKSGHTEPISATLHSEPVYATLHFYRNPDSMRLFRTCNESEAVRSAVHEYYEWLRSQIKYSEREELHPAMDKLFEIFGVHGVSVLDD
jgi:hypothetical protein